MKTGSRPRKAEAVCQRYNRVISPNIRREKWSNQEISILKEMIMTD